MTTPKRKVDETGANQRALPSNVVRFPRARRETPAAAPALQPSKRPVAVAAAQLNERLLLLLGICMIGATSALLAVHILHG